MTSRFSKLVPPKKDAETPAGPAEIEPKAKTARKKAKRGAGAPPIEAETREVIVLRAIGKRSKDAYTQVSAYIPKETHLRAKMALLEDGRDFSELVSDLLAEWLDRRG